jgi:hypothetical protein
MAKLVKELKDLEHAQRSRIAVRHGKVMINDQNVFTTWQRLSQECNVAISWPCYQLISPCLCEG